jgi:hypothetical protein
MHDVIREYVRIPGAYDLDDDDKQICKYFCNSLHVHCLKIANIPPLVIEITFVAFVGGLIVLYYNRLVYRRFHCQVKKA